METIPHEATTEPVVAPSKSGPDHLSDIVAELKCMITGPLQIPIEESQIDAAAPLLEGGLGLDSMTLFELVVLIEKRYGFTFPDQSLNSQVFGSLNAIAEHVRETLERANA